MTEPTNNLSAKFAALELLITTQHDALLAKFDDLRGGGPENTLKSINQSVWNLAGPAPGRSLVDLYNRLAKIDNGVGGWSDGASPPPGFPALQTILDRLSVVAVQLQSLDYLMSINNAIGGVPNNSLEIDSVRGLLNNIQTATGNMAECCSNMLLLQSDPLNATIEGLCSAPISSTGSSYIDIGVINASPYTVATWPEGIDNSDFSTLYGVIAQGYSTINCVDWTKYRIYVASKSDTFGIGMLNNERFSCNKWITMMIAGGADFNVIGSNSLKVYICPITAELGSCPGSEDPMIIESWIVGNKPAGGGTDIWELGDSSGGSTWASIIQFSEEGYWPAQNAISITRSTPNVGLCIAWNTSAEPELSRIGVRAFYNDGSGGGSEVGLTVGDIVIEQSSGSEIRSVNTAGGYSPTEFALIPYVSFPSAHPTAPNIEISISFVELTAS